MTPRNTLLLCSALLCSGGLALAQRPEPPKTPADEVAAKMMAFDSDKDGKLKKEEVTDERLHRLYDRADANKDGTVTVEELRAVANAKADPPPPRGSGGPPAGGLPDGLPGGFTPPKPGTILPGFLLDDLKLTKGQKAKLEELQKDVDERLDKLLTDEQRKVLKEFGTRGPFGGR